MENKINNAKEVLAKTLNFPKEIMLDLPRITITGDNEIDIENHKGIMLFEEDEVKINSKVGFIVIKGSGFEILFIGGTTVTISGNFKSITYEGYEQI
jgi:sporulation protein YqfC